MTYVLPPENATIADLYVWAANTTTGISSFGILLIVFCVVFFGTQRFGSQLHHSLLISVVATEMIAGALMIMGALSSLYVGIGAILVVFAYFFASQS